MPRGDRTGPNGEGRMTGRKMGLCVGNDTPGYTSSPGSNGRGAGNGRGQGSGEGFGGRRGFGGGFGRGGGFRFRHRFASDDLNSADQETAPTWFEQEFHKLKEQVLALQKRFSESGK